MAQTNEKCRPNPGVMSASVCHKIYRSEHQEYWLNDCCLRTLTKKQNKTKKRCQFSFTDGYTSVFTIHIRIMLWKLSSSKSVSYKTQFKHLLGTFNCDISNIYKIQFIPLFFFKNRSKVQAQDNILYFNCNIFLCQAQSFRYYQL